MDPNPVDLQILALLQEDGRRSVADIARQVSLSATAVQRRITRLEEAGVITGYSARVDYAQLGWDLEAYTELRFTGTTAPEDKDRLAAALPEITAIYTIAGDQDVIALIRARNVAHLRDVIRRLRATPHIVGTHTHLILDAHVKDGWHPEAAAVA
jgi:Lrp/AsnC family leucine-responsive transcriptional regulator